jgi:diacylglycerol kinase (ATP)
MIDIHFIVNPISGKGKHNISPSYLSKFFPESKFDIKVSYTKYKGHAVLLACEAAGFKPHCIVACGGDGTINEVATSLVNSDISLGIVPVGSGNGLASHLRISKNIAKALETIRNGFVFSMDVGMVNEDYFFSNMGIGIDAMIIKKYELSGKRSLLTYIRAAISSALDFVPKKAMLAYGARLHTVQSFLLFISNSNEMGYGMSLTPKASLDDGSLDLFIVPELTFFRKLMLSYLVLTQNVESFSKGTHTLIKSIKIEEPDTIFIDIQIDGEFRKLKTNKIHVSLIPKGLKVIVPSVES